MNLLFQIQVLHDYFRNGIFRTCAIVGDDGTLKIMSRYGLLARIQDGVFGCYLNTSEKPDDLLSYVNNQLQGKPLRFFLVTDEARFVFITDLPPDWSGQLEFDSKLTTLAKTEGKISVCLNAVLGKRLVDRASVIGVISIFLDDVMANGGSNIHYLVKFHARSLPWRYYLVNRSQTKLNDPVIRDKSHNYLHGPDPIVLPDGEKGLCFSSGATAYPLLEVPTRIFDLIDRLPPAMDVDGQALEHCVMNGLPTPAEDEIRWAGDSKKVFGAMYVYL